jgi:hypothetical protein
MKKATTLLLTLPILTGTAMAHPGPVGHTHDDDWPFDPYPYALLAIAFIGVSLISRFVHQRRAQQEAR